MEHRLGHDFAGVRVHSGAAAAQSALELNAKAYTVGHDIVFGAGRYAPARREGQRLIAHELTHVVQQSASSEARPGTLQRDVLEGPIAVQDVPELGAGWEEQILEVMKDEEDVETKAAVIQGLLFDADPEEYAALYVRLSSKKPCRDDKLVSGFNRTFKGKIRQRLLKRFEDVAKESRVARHIDRFADVELGADWEAGLLAVMTRNDDPEALAIDVQGELLHADVETYAALYARLSPQKPCPSDRLAVAFNRAFTGPIRQQLLRRFKEVAEHYWPATPDPFPHLPPGVAPGRKAQAVHQLGRVDAPRGVRLRSRPGVENGPVLPFDTLVSIESKTVEKKGQQSWLYVVALGDDKERRNVRGVGFLEEYFVARKPPEPTAHLHQVRPGELLKDIAASYYGHGFEWGHDARVYVQAIYHANKERDVVFRQNPDLTVDRRALQTDDLVKALELWREARVVEGQALWMPSDGFVRRLKAAGVIHHASITLDLWESTVGAVMALIDWAQYAAGFVIGLLEGAWNALTDLFTGVWDLIKAIGGVLKALFWDWDDLKAFGKKLKQLWENKEEIVDAIITDFSKKWDNPDDYDRGKFQGETLGYIMMTAFLMLVTLGGSAVIVGAGRLGKFIKLIQFMDKAGDVMFYAGKLKQAVKLPGKVVDKAHDLLKGRASKVLKVEPPHAPRLPDVDVPPVEAPHVEAPHAEVPHAGAPHAEAPALETGGATTATPPAPAAALRHAWNDAALVEDVALDLYKRAGVRKPLTDDALRKRFREGYRFDPSTRRWSKPHRQPGGRAPRAPTGPFLRDALKKVSDPHHPLHGLVQAKPGQPVTYDWRRTTRVTESGKTQTGRYPGSETGPVVQAGHSDAYASGAPQKYVLEDADLNIASGATIESKGAYSFKVAVEVEGLWVDLASLQQWERLLVVPSGTVAKATKL